MPGKESRTENTCRVISKHFSPQAVRKCHLHILNYIMIWKKARVSVYKVSVRPTTFTEGVGVFSLMRAISKVFSKVFKFLKMLIYRFALCKNNKMFDYCTYE